MNINDLEIRFFHNRKENGHPYMTICHIKYDHKVVSRGLALCSVQDNFSKKIGRDISFSRAMKALLSKRNLYPINRLNTNRESINKLVNTAPWCYKAEYLYEGVN